MGCRVQSLGQQVTEIDADELAARVTGQLLSSWVDVEDGAVGVSNHQGIIDAVKNPPETGQAEVELGGVAVLRDNQRGELAGQAELFEFALVGREGGRVVGRKCPE